jgi:hypothetical protein
MNFVFSFTILIIFALLDTQHIPAHDDSQVSADLPPRYTLLPPKLSNKPARSGNPILDRYYGETDVLIDLPAPEELTLPNRNIPPLRGSDLEEVLKAMGSVDRVSPQLFWRAVDKCECGKYFTKEALHDKHSKACMYWQNTNPLSPSSSSYCSTSDNQPPVDMVISRVRVRALYSSKGGWTLSSTGRKSIILPLNQQEYILNPTLHTTPKVCRLALSYNSPSITSHSTTSDHRSHRRSITDKFWP